MPGRNLMFPYQFWKLNSLAILRTPFGVGLF